MAQGMRQIQAQVRGIQAQVTAASKEQLQILQQHAARYGTIFGNPRSFEQTKRNIETIQRTRMRYQSQLAIAETAAEREALRSKIGALDITKRDLQSKLQGYQVTVNEARTKERMLRLGDKERRDEEKALQRRRQMYGSIGHGAFTAATYAGGGALAIGGGLFEAWKAAAQQQQLATTTAMVMGYKGGAQTLAANQLFQSQLKNSMSVGLLSSADVAAVQTQLAMHVPGLGMKNLLALTPLVSKFADVMKMTNIPGAQDPAQSAAVAAMVANVFNARKTSQMRKILEQFFVMEQSTGADVSTAVNAISQYGALGKSLGFRPQDMIDLYGAMFRIGAGGGKVGARLGTLMTEIGSIPTSVMRAWGSTQLGLVDNSGIPNILKQKGGPTFDAYLKLLSREYTASIKKFGPAVGKAKFLTEMTATYGKTGEKVLFPLIQSGSIENYEAQIKRHQQFSTIEQAQATFFNLPINQWKRFMTNLQTLIIAFGHADVKSFADVFSYWADQFERWTSWIQGHPGATKKMFDDLLHLAEGLALFSAISGGVGAIAKGVSAYMTVRSGIAALAKAMGKAGTVETGMENLAAGVGKNGAGGLVVARLATIAGSLAPIAATLAFFKGLQVNAKLGTKGINPNVLTPGTAFGSNYAFPGPYNLTTGQAILAPNGSRGQSWEVNVYVGNKKIVPDTIRVLNKGMRAGRNATTTRQGTVYQSPIETLNQSLQPHVR
jgi:hypothetical protein